MSNKVVMVAGVLVGVLLVAGVAFLVPRIIGGNKREAEDACRAAIEQGLKSPASAEWGDPQVNENGAGLYDVAITVDAENGFGALIRATYICSVDNGKVVDVYSNA